MGKDIKLTVRAQRKYAHKAYIPNKQIPFSLFTGAAYKIDGEAPEADLLLPPQPVLITRKPVGDFLNQVAYKNIHPEHPEDSKLKDVRVVLKRLSPIRQVPQPNNIAENDNDGSPRVSEKKHTGNDKDRHPRVSEKKHTGNDKDRSPRVSEKKHTGNDKDRSPRVSEKKHTGNDKDCSPRVSEKKHTENDKDRSPRVSEKKHTENDKDGSPRVSEKKHTENDNDLSPRVRSKRQKRNINIKSNSDETKLSLSDSKLNLRGRSITKKCPLKNVSKPNLKFRTITKKNPPKTVEKENRIGESSRRMSETSNEDNRPLTYYARNKSNEASATILTNKVRKSSRIKSGTTSQYCITQTCVKPKKRQQLQLKANEEIQFKSSSLNETLPGKQQHQKTSLQAQSVLKRKRRKVKKVVTSKTNDHKVQKQIQLKNPKRNIINKEEIRVPVSSEVLAESSSESLPQKSVETFEPTREKTRVSQSNPFADFVIGVFNNNCENQEGQEERYDRGEGSGSDCSLARVQEWLMKSVPQDDAQFKVPALPRRRVVAPPSNASISLNRPLSTKEKILRFRCIAWNYKPLSELNTQRHLIRLFCGECTRCVVMFKTEYLKKSTQKTTDVSDIYEFSTDRDDDTLDTQINRNIFRNISIEKDHLTKLKLIMTEKGRKIHKTAIIIKEKIEHNKSLLPKEHAVLAQVIGILNQCNAARIKDSLLTCATQGTKRLAHSYDSISVATSSKRQRLESVRDPSPPTSVRESKKFLPTQEEFKENPIKYACKIQQNHPGVSLCGIIPPKDFRPVCKEGCDDNNFKISNQYVHRMLNRWGTATRQLTAIRSIQDPKIQRSPLFEGLEVDLVKLFHTVQSENGIEACQNNNEKWQTIAQKMKLYCRGKANTKLENIYLKYLLSYNTLTPDERKKADTEVGECWTKREIESVVRAQQPLWRQNRMSAGIALDDDKLPTHLEKVCAEAEECVTPGRNTNYNNFCKLAKQVERTYFPNSTPSPEEVEQEYWNIVLSADTHVCVHAASVDAAAQFGCGFTDDISEPYGTHQWNLKRLCWNSANLLSYLGPTVGVSSTSIHYGMMFSTSCWHMDPTSVPWIEFLHSGQPKIWYTISANQEQKFRAAAEALCPFAVQNKDIWLPSDIIMIPPNLLRQYGVVVERHVQHVGEYVIVYPKTYCACIDTGLTISEGVYFAPHNWIIDIERIFLNLRNCCEPSLFSMEKLLIAMSNNEETPVFLLQRVHTVLTSLLCAELSYRRAMVDRNIELVSPRVFLEQNRRASASSWQIQKSGECAYCRCHLYLSRVVGVTLGQTGVCAFHGISLFDSAMSRRNPPEVVFCVMLVTNNSIYSIINRLKQRMMGSVSTAI